MRALILVIALLPFLVYAWRDNVYHLRDRKPSMVENVVHLLIGVGLAGAISAGFRDDIDRMIVSLAWVVLVGAVDELGFHHRLPGEESDIHAKEHFTFFGWTVVVLGLHLYGGAS